MNFRPIVRFAGRPQPRRAAIALLSTIAATTVGCGISESQEPIRFTTTPWSYKGIEGSKLTSDHYEIYTTCKRKVFVQALPGFLETCYRAYSDLLPTQDPPDRPLVTYLFQRRVEWERFTEEFAPARAETYKRIRGGGYSERGITVSHYGTQRSTLSILAHEGLHQYLEVTGRHRIPAWINEGLACNFESFDLDRENRPVFKPERNTLRSPALRQAVVTSSLIPLREILTTNAGIAIHQKSRHVRNYYSQEWSLVLFLLQSSSNKPYSAGFRRLLDELGADAMKRKTDAYLAADTDDSISLGEAVFRAYVAEDIDAFEADYRDYIQQLLTLQNF